MFSSYIVSCLSFSVARTFYFGICVFPPTLVIFSVASSTFVFIYFTMLHWNFTFCSGISPNSFLAQLKPMALPQGSGIGTIVQNLHCTRKPKNCNNYTSVSATEEFNYSNKAHDRYTKRISQRWHLAGIKINVLTFTTEMKLTRNS